MEDVPAIVAIEQASFHHAGERFADRKIRHLIASPRAIATVAEGDGQVLAWAAGLFWARGRDPWGRIFALAVHPDGRGQRIGERLLDDIVQRLRTRGARRIFLEVRTDNHAAIRLYERFGFRACKALADYYAPNINAIRMQWPVK